MGFNQFTQETIWNEKIHSRMLFSLQTGAEKKLSQLGLDKKRISEVNLSLSFLTVLPEEHVEREVQWLEQTCTEDKIKEYWEYFRIEYISTRPPKMWQLLNYDKKTHTILTTNGLERFFLFLFFNFFLFSSHFLSS